MTFSPVIIAYLTFGIGFASLAAAAYFARQLYNRRGWTKLTGVVISNREDASDDCSYYPTIAVEHNGERIEFESEIGSYPAKDVGTCVRVLKNPISNECRESGVSLIVLSIIVPLAIGLIIPFLGWSSYQESLEENQTPEIHEPLSY